VTDFKPDADGWYPLPAQGHIFNSWVKPFDPVEGDFIPYTPHIGIHHVHEGYRVLIQEEDRGFGTFRTLEEAKTKAEEVIAGKQAEKL